MTDSTSPKSDEALAISAKNIAERYQLLEKIGEGGMGTVFKAKQLATSRTVAIKFLSGRLHKGDARLARFEQEMRMASTFNHPNLVSIVDYGSDAEERPFIVLDFVPGIGLDSLLEQQKHLKPHDLIEIFCQICKGLAHMHQNGVVHRDLKPSNIMVDQNEAGETRVTIVDFGLAKLDQTQSQSLTQTGEVIGSPLYMSPEQSLGQKIDHRSDIYSLGCMMFEAVTGVPPFLGENPVQTICMRVMQPAPTFAEVAPAMYLPEALEKVVQKSLKREPEERYQSVAALQADLRELEKERTLPSATAKGLRNYAQAPQPERAPQRPRWLLPTVLTALMLSSAGILWILKSFNFHKESALVSTAPAQAVPTAAVKPAPTQRLKTTEPAAHQSESQSAASHQPKDAVAKNVRTVPLPPDIQEDLDANRRAESQNLAAATSGERQFPLPAPTATSNRPPRDPLGMDIPPQFEEVVQRGVQAQQHGDLNKADTMLSRALRMCVNTPRMRGSRRMAEICFREAEVLSQLGNHAGARIRYERATQIFAHLGERSDQWYSAEALFHVAQESQTLREPSVALDIYKRCQPLLKACGNTQLSAAAAKSIRQLEQN